MRRRKILTARHLSQSRMDHGDLSSAEPSINSGVPRKRLMASLTFGVLALLFSACGLASPPPPPLTAASPVAVASIVSAPTYNEGFCIDPTASTVATFSEGIKQELVNVLSGWEGGVQRPNPAGSPGVPGLNLEVRQVLTDSYSSGDPYVQVSIPAVPALLPEPNVNSANFVAQDIAWQSAKQEVRSAEASARSAAQQAASAVGAMTLQSYPDVLSEIAGCVSALAETVPDTNRSLILASDLEQNEPPQFAGQLSNTRVLIIQACDGEAASCSGWQTIWQSLLNSEGAQNLGFIRPEQASAVLPNFMKGVAS